MAFTSNFKPARETPEAKRRRKMAEAFARKRQKQTVRKAPRKRSASASDDLAWSKGPTRKALKTVEDAAEAVHVQAVRTQVWSRSPLRCEVCGGTEDQTAAKSGKRAHEMHETYSRAKTRGCKPERRFDQRWCIRVCSFDHRQFTANTVHAWFQSRVLGAMGPMRVSKDRPDGWFSSQDVWEAAA